MYANNEDEPLVRLLTPQEQRAIAQEAIEHNENEMRLEMRRHEVTISRLKRRRDELEASLRRIHD